MTTVVVLADSPDSVGRLDGLVPDPLPADKAKRLSRAMLVDICAIVQHGEADLLVNHPTDDPDAGDRSTTETALRDLLDTQLPRPEAVRYEPQVGSDRAARVGNALTHLLGVEGAETVAVAEPTAPFLRRDHVGAAAMKLRTSEVVLGPAPGGRVAFAGFREPVDFANIYETPPLETFTRRAIEADLGVDFLPMVPLLEGPSDLRTGLSVLTARRAAGRLVPPRTAAVVEELGLAARVDDDRT